MLNLKILLLAMGLAAPALTRAQAPQLLSGIVVDARTKAPLPYTSLGLRHTGIGTVSNAEGTFRLQVPAGHAADTVEVQCLGYAPLRLRLQPALFAATQTLVLTPQEYQLSEVQVTAYTLRAWPARWCSTATTASLPASMGATPSLPTAW
jgi:hypothetical protein